MPEEASVLTMLIWTALAPWKVGPAPEPPQTDGAGEELEKRLLRRLDLRANSLVSPYELPFSRMKPSMFMQP